MKIALDFLFYISTDVHLKCPGCAVKICTKCKKLKWQFEIDLRSANSMTLSHFDNTGK